MRDGNDSIQILATEIAGLLVATGDFLVLAESCTGGLVAASLARVPGISQHFCGSAVTYREHTKTRWLGVPAELIRRHTAVSSEVTRSMVSRVLERTPEATLAAAVTGHLGPDAPPQQDGAVFIAVARRFLSHGTLEMVLAESDRLESSDRPSRQVEAAGKVLECVRRCLLEIKTTGLVE